MITLPEDPGSLPAWDREALFDRVMEDESLAEMIISDLLETAPNDFAGLQTAMDMNNPEAILKHIHRINGAAGNVGAIRLHVIAYDTEAALHNHTAVDLAARFLMLKEAYTAFQKAFAAWRETRPQR